MYLSLGNAVCVHVCVNAYIYIYIYIRRNATQTTKIVHYDWSLLNNRDISNKYMITLRNKFDALQEISETLTPNDEYENFINAHMEAAAECIPPN